MRIDLGELAADGLALELPARASGGPEQRIVVNKAEGLRGTFVLTASGWQLSNVACARLQLDGFVLQFGELELSLRGHGELGTILAEVGIADGDLELDVELQQAQAAALSVQIGALRLSAGLQARKLRLAIRGGVGRLLAEHALFSAFALDTAALRIEAPELTTEQLLIGWGDTSFRLEAALASAPELTLEGQGSQLRAQGVAVEQLVVVGPHVRAGGLRIARAELDAALTREPDSQDGADDERATSALDLDYGLLDGLAGALHVDVTTDVTLPVLGSRRATHAFRVAVDGGAIDYRALEGDLARLEDSLLDFSVRESTLVLELGLPLVATRGRGKPLLVWELSPSDLALAQRQRVRLAVLPELRTASTPSEPPEGRGSSRVKLRSLAFENIETQLALYPVSGRGAVRSLAIAKIALAGSLRHDAEGAAREGVLRVGLEGVESTIRTLALMGRTLDGTLELGALRDLELTFVGLRPVRVRGVLEGLTLSELEHR